MEIESIQPPAFALNGNFMSTLKLIGAYQTHKCNKTISNNYKYLKSTIKYLLK